MSRKPAELIMPWPALMWTRLQRGLPKASRNARQAPSYPSDGTRQGRPILPLKTVPESLTVSDGLSGVGVEDRPQEQRRVSQNSAWHRKMAVKLA